MTKIGIVEGFFGPSWPEEARKTFAPFMKNYGGDFYIYAPKRDAFLRKSWREYWPVEYLNFLEDLKQNFNSHGIKFGVAISPFGLGTEISNEDWKHLREKLKILSNLKLDYLGLFFDDMPSTDKLLDVQKSVVNLAKEYFSDGLIFCPSYYSFDPILDKVFGARPPLYVEALSQAIAAGVEVCWTGPKVISDEIPASHLIEVSQLIGRKPFIWENLFANDGPKNCKFLKLRYFSGRDEHFLDQISGISFNLMNQPYLSQLLYLASVMVLKNKLEPAQAFEASCKTLCSPKLSQLIIEHRLLFLATGLDGISQEMKSNLIELFNLEGSVLSLEIVSWLKGDYIVGPECLTD
jgi:hyaluronoglucosaminidase